MNNNWYINVLGWMINEMRLSWNRLLLYAIIYWYSQDWENTYRWSLTYIQKALWLSKPTVVSLLKSLTDEWFIEKIEGSKKTLPSEYKVVKKFNYTSKETLLPASKETLPNINNNINNNINSEAEEIYSFYIKIISPEKKWVKKALSIERIKKALKNENKEDIINIIKTYKKEKREDIEKGYAKAPQYFFGAVERGSKVQYYEEFKWREEKIIEIDDSLLVF